MLTRTHIAMFVGVTLAALIAALAAHNNGIPLLHILKSFGIVVAIVTVVVAVFVKYAWSWWVFRSWFVKRPDLRGTWKVTLFSNWRDPATGEGAQPIQAYMVVRQTLAMLNMRLMTHKSRSTLIAHAIEPEEDGLYRLAAAYQNLPQIEYQGVDSEIHHGALLVQIHEDYPDKFEGHYWTDRNTRGTIRFEGRVSVCYKSHADAVAGFADSRSFERELVSMSLFGRRFRLSCKK